MFDALAKNTLAPLVLRLALAAVFIFHGLSLVLPDGNQWGAAWMKQPDAPPAAAQLAAAWGQLLGGLALAIGFLTRLAALGLIAIMAGAIALVHLPHGFDNTKNGYEYNVVIIAVCVALVLTGGGALSLDRLLWRRRRP